MEGKMEGKEEENDFEEIVPKKHRSSTSAIVLAVVLSGLVFGGVGYWYGSTKEKGDSGETVLKTATPIVSKTPVLSKTPTRTISATSVVSITPSATVSATTTTTPSDGLTRTATVSPETR